MTISEIEQEIIYSRQIESYENFFVTEFWQNYFQSSFLDCFKSLLVGVGQKCIPGWSSITNNKHNAFNTWRFQKHAPRQFSNAQDDIP